MTETLHCPACQAILTLPALPDGQSVQCPRCQHVFEVRIARAAVRAATAPPTPAQRHEPDDDPPFVEQRVVRPGDLQGVRTSYVLIAMLAACILSFGVQTCLDFEQSILLEEQRPFGARRHFGQFEFQRQNNGPDANLEQRWDEWELWSEVSAFFHHLIYWPTALVFLIWFTQVSSNVTRRLQARGLAHTPGSAFFSFFVPLMNLWWPYVIAQEIWRGSHPHAVETPLSWVETPRSRLLGWWWFFWVSALFLSLVAYAGSDAVPGPTDTSVRASIVSHLCMIAAGLLLIGAIRELTKRQQARYARLYEEAA